MLSNVIGKVSPVEQIICCIISLHYFLTDMSMGKKDHQNKKTTQVS